MCLNIKVTSIKEAADIEPRNQFESLVFRICRFSLPMQVEMVGVRRSLPVSFLERFPMPYTIIFIDIHVVHMDGYPYVACRVCYLVVDIVVYDEVIGLDISILYVINARFRYFRKVKMQISVLVEVSP